MKPSSMTKMSNPSGVPQRITPSSTVGKKRHGGNNGGSSSGSSGNKQDTKRRKMDHMDLDPIFPKLDQSDPAHAKRIQQRRKTVQMGKNTAGYFEYVKQVPKERRRPRSMDTPNTPDHTLDIPTKRWQGIVKAWRIALHKYDPADLQTNDDAAKATAAEKAKAQSKSTVAAKDATVQSRQIEDALAKGLLVDVSPSNNGLMSPQMGTNTGDADCCSPASVMSEDNNGRKNLMDLEEWNGKGFGEDDDDSDDDLL